MGAWKWQVKSHRPVTDRTGCVFKTKKISSKLVRCSGPHWNNITTLTCFIVIIRYRLLWYILNLIELYPEPLSYKQHKAARRALKAQCSDPQVRRL